MSEERDDDFISLIELLSEAKMEGNGRNHIICEWINKGEMLEAG